MSQLSPSAKKVMELLLAGNAEEAKRFVEKKYTQEIEELRVQLQDKESERSQLYAIIGLAKPSSGNGKTQIVSKSENAPVTRKIPKDERSDVVKQTAAEIATMKGGKITPLDVVRALTAKGLHLDSPVPATVVGNVLYKAPDRFERIEKGIYRYIGAH